MGFIDWIARCLLWNPLSEKDKSQLDIQKNLAICGRPSSFWVIPRLTAQYAIWAWKWMMPLSLRNPSSCRKRVVSALGQKRTQTFRPLILSMRLNRVSGRSFRALGRGEQITFAINHARSRTRVLDFALHLVIVDYTQVRSMVLIDESELATMGGRNGL